MDRWHTVWYRQSCPGRWTVHPLLDISTGSKGLSKIKDIPRNSSWTQISWNHLCSQLISQLPELCIIFVYGPLPDTHNCGLRMRRECRERFPRHWLQRKPLVSDPDMHHGTCVTHVPSCMSRSPTRGRVKRSRYSRRMRNPQFYVSGKRPIARMWILCKMYQQLKRTLWTNKLSEG